MDQPCMGYYMQFITTMYLPLFHHFTLVLGPVISMLIHVDDRHVLEECHGLNLQRHVWGNDVVSVMICHVYDPFSHRR